MGITKCRNVLDDYATSACAPFSVENMIFNNDLKKTFLKEVDGLSNKDLRTIYKEQMILNEVILKNFAEMSKNMSDDKKREQYKRFKAYLFILETIQDKLYDYKQTSPRIIKFAELPNLSDMYEEYADFSAHNTRTAVSEEDRIDLRTCTQAMRNLIAGKKVDINDNAREGVIAHIQDNRQEFVRVADENMNKLLDTYPVPDNMPDDINVQFQHMFERMINIQKGYNLDMVEKYHNQFFGLIPTADKFLAMLENDKTL